MTLVANTELSLSLPDDGQWSEPLGVHGLTIWFGGAYLSMDLHGWLATSDDQFPWVGENDERPTAEAAGVTSTETTQRETRR